MLYKLWQAEKSTGDVSREETCTGVGRNLLGHGGRWQWWSRPLVFYCRVFTLLVISTLVERIQISESHMFMTLRSSFLLLITLTMLISGGCDSVGEIDVLPGSYRADTFKADVDGERIDLLPLGGLVTVKLRQNRTARGLVRIPAEATGNGQGEFVIPFDGSYTVDGNTVRFQPEEDVFIRDAGWTWLPESGVLRIEGTRFDVTLKKLRERD